MTPAPDIAGPTQKKGWETRRIAFVECRSGVSGDMMLGALVDAGFPITKLRSELRKLGIRGYTIKSSSVSRGGITASRVQVSVGDGIRLRKWDDVRRTIERSPLASSVKKTSLAVFRRLFDAEAQVHGGTRRSVHLHELGAVDCIVDIVGTAIGLHVLGVQAVHASRINVGSGTIKTEHGVLPVPGPATAKLLEKAPVFTEGPAFEMTTPTGAAIVSTLAASYGTLPEMELQTVGIGAGGHDPDGWANVLRIFLGTAPSFDADEDIVIVETTIDDMDPRGFEPLAGKLFSRGALDVFLEPVFMKKYRPGLRLTVLCREDTVQTLADTILEETPTLGIRMHGASRRTLDRRICRVTTVYGSVRIKVAFLRERPIRSMPEYDDVKRMAAKAGISFRRALGLARKAAEQQLGLTAAVAGKPIKR